MEGTTSKIPGENKFSFFLVLKQRDSSQKQLVLKINVAICAEKAYRRNLKSKRQELQGMERYGSSGKHWRHLIVTCFIYRKHVTCFICSAT